MHYYFHDKKKIVGDLLESTSKPVRISLHQNTEKKSEDSKIHKKDLALLNKLSFMAPDHGAFSFDSP